MKIHFAILSLFCVLFFHAQVGLEGSKSNVILLILASLAGAQLPENQVEGRSLPPLLENPGAEWSDRYLFAHKGRWKTGEDPETYKWINFAVRNQRFRHVSLLATPRMDRNGQKTKAALYDMEADPAQTTDVISATPGNRGPNAPGLRAILGGNAVAHGQQNAPMSPTRSFHVLDEKQLTSGGIPGWVPPEGLGATASAAEGPIAGALP